MEIGLAALTASTKLAYLTSFVDRNREHHRLPPASVSRIRPSQALLVDGWTEINNILAESGYCPILASYLSRYTRIAATKSSGEIFSAFE